MHQSPPSLVANPDRPEAVFEHVHFEGIPVEGRRSTWTCALAPKRGAAVEPDADEWALIAWLFGESGLVASAYRPRALLRRLPACLRWLRVADVAAARAKLASQPALVPTALNIVLLGVTEFFRDAAVFERIEDLVLPALAARPDRLRVWSAACSEGPELYSVAMLLADRGWLDRAELLGTDFRPEAIAVARNGGFAAEAFGRLEARWRNRFRDGSTVSESLRAAITWRTGDLLRAVEPGPWHLLLWRNMAIYLEMAAAERIWGALCDELAVGGYLVAGKADHPPKRLPLVRVAPCIYRKVAEA